MGGNFTSPISSLAREPKMLDLFGIGTNSAVFHKSYDSLTGWTGWNSIGGKLTSNIAITSLAFNDLQVFGRGTDNAMWWNQWDGVGWFGWVSLGGDFISEPSAVSWKPSESSSWVTEVFVGDSISFSYHTSRVLY